MEDKKIGISVRNIYSSEWEDFKVLAIYKRISTSKLLLSTIRNELKKAMKDDEFVNWKRKEYPILNK